MKKCLICKKEKEYCEFNKNKIQADGYYYYCRECNKEYKKGEYLRNKESYFRRCRDWRKTDIGKKSIKKTYLKQKEKYPEKYKARCLLNSYVVAGKIIKPKKCENCGSYEKICSHHNDYKKPLDVQWLCYKCHTKLHSLNQYYGI